jgi:hypothetical protein
VDLNQKPRIAPPDISRNFGQMESIFSYISFEDDQLFAPSELDDQRESAQNSVSKPIVDTIKMVRTASAMALNKLGLNRKPSGQKGILEKTGSAAIQTTKLIFHQIKAIPKLFVISRNSSLNTAGQFLANWLRHTLNSPHISLQTVRMGTNLSDSLMRFQSGVNIQKISFTANLNEIRKLEEQGLAHLQNSNNWQYPLPCDLESEWEITGEWTVPLIDSKNISKRERLFGKFLSEKRSKKVIYYLHGGKFLIDRRCLCGWVLCNLSALYELIGKK